MAQPAGLARPTLPYTEGLRHTSGASATLRLAPAAGTGMPPVTVNGHEHHAGQVRAE